MKNILIASALFISGAFAAEPNYAINPVPRDGGWVKRHESFNAISKQGTATLVFLGDSITQGWEGKGKATWEKFYAKRNAANFGIGGDRTEHVLWRLDNGNFDGLKPKLIVLMIGTNNTGHVGRAQKELNGAIYASSAEQTAEGVKVIVGKLQAKAPEAKILLLGIFPRGEKPTDAMRQQNEATNAIIAKLADGKQVHFMDIGKTFLQPDGTLTREVMPDLLHLSEKGYDMWAEAIDPKIKELLGE
ncbi:MAG: platelet-activating factor acetylhydrolase IB subunit [Verrucomicrobiota bacterium]